VTEFGSIDSDYLEARFLCENNALIGRCRIDNQQPLRHQGLRLNCGKTLNPPYARVERRNYEPHACGTVDGNQGWQFKLTGSGA
jgi:hypothetical protein